MAKKQWLSIKRGLIRDPKHRLAMGECFWLFGYMIDVADWDTGIIPEWKDEAAADDMQMQLRTLREQRRKLETLDYISCSQKKYGQEIRIINWTNPREYSGETYNPRKGGSKTPPSGKAEGYTEGDTQGYTEGSSQDVTPTSIPNNQIPWKLYPLEWYIQMGQPIPEQLLNAAQLEKSALDAFESDMHVPASWVWYPAKSSEEKAWKTLREFVVKIYQTEPDGFAKYHTWSNQPYSRGAMTVLAIKRNPAEFELSWAAYKAANPEAPKEDRTSMLRTLS